MTERRGASASERVPVIAITGHLGAGKTSLLNHLLRRPGARLGVVVNDFGRLDVDAALVSGQIDEAASIAGGCLCCLPDAGGLDDALERLSQPKLRLDAILVEASGVADPIALSRLIRFSGAERVRPGGVIEVVDAVEYFRTVDTRPTPPARFTAATVVVIGKTDLVPADERDERIARIRERVAACDPTLVPVVARHGGIDPALVFDAVAGEDPADELPIAALIREAGSHGAAGHGEAAHEHARSASIALTGPVSPSALVDLLEDPPHGAYRLKGRVGVRGTRGERGYVVHLVGRSIHVAPLAAPPAPHGELVAIGLDLDAEAAEERLRAVAAAPAERPDPEGLRRLRRHRVLSQ